MRRIPIFSLLAFAACGPAPAPTEVHEEHLYGDVKYDNATCTAGLKSFHEKVMKYGRVASASKAFEQCIAQKVNDNTYRQCNGDPGYGLPKAQQIALVLAVARSPNDVGVACAGSGVGNASAGSVAYDHAQVESFTWGGWLASVYGQLSLPACTPTKTTNCRFAPDPWPYSQAAGIAWHEVMHTHTYGHGANEQTAAIVNCGYAGDPSWDFQRNTMPYLVGQCINEVIDQSGTICGDVESCGGSNRLRFIDTYGDAKSTCSCQHDPRNVGFGTLGLDPANGQIEEEIVYASGDWFTGGWHYGHSDQILASADLDGDGDEEIVLKSGWGLAVARKSGERLHAVVALPWSAWIDGWNLGSADTVIGVGNFDGGAHEEIVLRSGWGIGVIGLRNGQLTLLAARAFGTAAGAWTMSSADSFHGVAAFEGNGRDSLLVRKASVGFAFLGLTSWATGDSSGNYASGHLLSAPRVYAVGTRFGGWLHGAADVFAGLGDFDGNGRADLVIRSGWGIGILGASGNSLTTLAIHAHGAWIGGWKLASTDAGHTVADFDGDGKAELLLRGGGGLGFFGRSGAGSLLAERIIAPTNWVDGWKLGTLDTLHGAGDVDGDGRADLVIRSGWGLGVISPFQSAVPRLIDAEAFGTLFGAWLLDAGDAVVGLGDYDGDGRAELLLKSAS